MQGTVITYLGPVIWISFLAVAAFFGIISVILNYHWTRYGVRKERIRLIRQIYFGVSIALFAALTTVLVLLSQ